MHFFKFTAITIDSYMMLRDLEYPLLFPPVITFHKTKEYHNKCIYITISHWSFEISQFHYACLCLYLVLQNFITCRLTYLPPESR